MMAEEEQEISLLELLRGLWQERWWVLGITAVATIAAAAAAWVVPKKYAATVVIAPVSNDPSRAGLGNLGSLISQFGGLASLAGVSIGDDTGKLESIAVLQSEALTQRYIVDNQLLRVLFAKAWDADAQQWKTQDPEKVPTPWKATQYFKKKVRKVLEDKKSGMVNLTVVWSDPHLAAQWANDLVRLTNDYMRNKAIHESERHIEYLSAEALKTEVVQVRNAIFSIMESEIKRAMLARGTDEYALKVIDPAVPPEIAAFPQKLIWTLAGFLGGGVLSLLFVLGRNAFADAARGSRAGDS